MKTQCSYLLLSCTAMTVGCGVRLDVDRSEPLTTVDAPTAPSTAMSSTPPNASGDVPSGTDSTRTDAASTASDDAGSSDTGWTTPTDTSSTSSSLPDAASDGVQTSEIDGTSDATADDSADTSTDHPAPSSSLCHDEPTVIQVDWAFDGTVPTCDPAPCLAAQTNAAGAIDGSTWAVSRVVTEGVDSNVSGVALQRLSANGAASHSEMLTFSIVDREATVSHLSDVSVDHDGRVWVSVFSEESTPGGQSWTTATEVLRFADDGAPFGAPIVVGPSHPVSQINLPNNDLLLALGDGVVRISGDGEVSPHVTYADGTTTLVSAMFDTTGRFVGLEHRRGQVPSQDAYWFVSYSATGELSWQEQPINPRPATFSALPLGDGSSIWVDYPQSGFGTSHPSIQWTRRDAEGQVAEVTTVTPGSDLGFPQHANPVQDADGNIYIAGLVSNGGTTSAAIHQVGTNKSCRSFVLSDAPVPFIRSLRVTPDGGLLIGNGDALARVTLPLP